MLDLSNHHLDVPAIGTLVASYVPTKFMFKAGASKKSLGRDLEFASLTWIHLSIPCQVRLVSLQQLSTNLGNGFAVSHDYCPLGVWSSPHATQQT